MTKISFAKSDGNTRFSQAQHCIFVRGVLLILVDLTFLEVEDMPEFVTKRECRVGNTLHGEVGIKTVRISGKEPGLLLGLVSGIHGDEFSSIVGLRRFLYKLIHHYRQDQVRGEILAIPLANPLALMQRTHGFHLNLVAGGTYENLQDYFPGDAEGTLGERMARTIFNILTKETPTCVIDIHCAPSRSDPHIVIDSVPMSPSVSRMVWKVAESFGLGVVYDFGDEQYKKMGMQHSLSGALVSVGIPALTVEVPGGSVPQNDAAWSACNGLWNVVSDEGLGIVPGHPVYADHESKSRLGVGKFQLLPGPRANAAGIFEPTACALGSLATGRQGEMLREGEIIGEIWDGYGDMVEEIRAPQECMVAYIIDTAPVSSGDELFCLLVPKEE